MSAEVLARIEAKLDRLLLQTGPKMPAEDEKIFKDPKEKYWPGESYAGNRMSECPAPYLRAYAKYKNACVYTNRKEGNPDKAQYLERDEKTARLANAWAEYREMTTPARTTTSEPATFDDDVTF